jgi:ion channel-forming bestrophin family protein
MILRFRNDACYSRWWEARTLWGSIVNYSRCVARQAVTLISVGARPQDREQVRDIQRRIVRRAVCVRKSSVKKAKKIRSLVNFQ